MKVLYNRRFAITLAACLSLLAVFFVVPRPNPGFVLKWNPGLDNIADNRPKSKNQRFPDPGPVSNLTDDTVSASHTIIDRSAESEEEHEPLEQEITAGLSAAFHLMIPDKSINIASEICAACVDDACRVDCQTYEQMTGYLSKASVPTSDARLFIIPIDPLAWRFGSHGMADEYRNASDAMISFVRNSYDYRTFKGSDYVFICLGRWCPDMGKELGRSLSLTRGTRAIFAGASLEVDSLKWPCPLRVINLESSNSHSPTATADLILSRAMKLIEKRNRWVCADDKNPANYWEDDFRKQGAAGFYIKEFGFVLCTMPKCGSSMTNALLRRLMHYGNWNETGTGLNHGPKSGLTVYNKMSKKPLRKIHKDLSIPKGIIVRHPVTRLLSGYLDKIRDKRQFHRVGGLAPCMKANKKRQEPFHSFVRCLVSLHPKSDNLDQHFRPQSAECKNRQASYDFIGKEEHILDEIREFGESLGFWEEYGATGWGDGTHAFGEKSYQARAHGSANLIWQYYTEDLIMEVYNYYKEDFIRFGFTVEEILETKPKSNSTAFL